MEHRGVGAVCADLSLQATPKESMLKTYSFEALTALTVAFMVFYPPEYGVIVCALTLAVLSGLTVLSSLDRKKSPALQHVEADLKELKTKVEQLILRGNR